MELLRHDDGADIGGGGKQAVPQETLCLEKRSEGERWVLGAVSITFKVTHDGLAAVSFG